MKANKNKSSVRLIIFSLIIACGTININQDWDKKTIYNPIVDSGKRVHDYKMSSEFELGNDYSLYCIRHQTWEIVSPSYYKTTDSIQYIVRDAWPK
jgi:hypothetical protein